MIRDIKDIDLRLVFAEPLCEDRIKDDGVTIREILESFDCLSDKEFIILAGRINVYRAKTLRELGEEFSITKESVRQNQCRAMRKVRKNIRRIISSRFVKLEVSKIWVDTLDFPVRVLNCFRNAKIITIEDLLKKTRGELLKYRNFDIRSLVEVEKALAEYGLNIGDRA